MTHYIRAMVKNIAQNSRKSDLYVPHLLKCQLLTLIMEYATINVYVGILFCSIQFRNILNNLE